VPCPDVARVTPEASALHRRALVLDLHAHPSLKTSLFGLRLDTCHRPGGAFNPLSLRCDLPKLVAGGVNVLCSAVYVPERGLLDDCRPLAALAPLVPPVSRLLKGDPFHEAMRVLDDLEQAVSATPAYQGVRLAVARTPAVLKAIRQRGDLAIVHALEGGHHLSGDAANVARFAERGVAILTLAHFYPNGIAFPVDGIPPDMKFLGCFRQPKDLTGGLTDLGRTVIEECIRCGVLVDLTHCTEPARRAAFDVLGTRHPVVMTHVGARTLQDVPMNPTAAEVRRIADGGGLIGVIAMNYWLGGNDGGNGGGIQLMVRTVRELARQGGIEAVAIGTDFDGFTDPPDDLPDPASLPRLTEALLTAGLQEREVELVLGLNAERVLREAWRLGG
jgi:membrane dipeptidase